MKKLYFPAFALCLSITAFAQKKPNPKIGKNEIEISLLYSEDKQTSGYISNRLKSLGGEVIYRVPWKKTMKIGGGLLVSRNESVNIRTVNHFYGAGFADFVKFIGKRQKWSLGLQVGRGIYKLEYKFNDSTVSGFNKTVGGMYYTLLFNYRAIVSKKILITITPFSSIRNFRHKTFAEYFSPPSVEKTMQVEQYDGFGLRIGVVF